MIMEAQNIVREGDSVILKKGKSMKVYKIFKKEKVFLEKRHFALGPIIGHPYGSSWELQNGGLVPVTEQALSHDIAGQIEEGGADNRMIVDDQTSQKLDRDDITDLKEQGKSGQEIIDHLVENSSTFNERTVYSKAKYLKKKQNKHIMKFVVLRPSTRLLCDLYFNKAPSKHIQIRVDSLSQMLTATNLQSGSRVMVMEHCQGLLVGAVMERLGGNGTIVQFHTEEMPLHTVLASYNFPRGFKETLRTFNLKEVYNTLVKKPDDETTGEVGRDPNGTDTSTARVAPDANKDCMEERTEGSGAVQTDCSSQGTAEQVFLPRVDSGGQPKIEPLLGEDVQQSELTSPESRKRKKKDEERYDRKRQKLEAQAKTRDILLERNMDTLLIATKYHPAPIVLALIDMLALSRPFAVFSPYKEALMECYVKLRDRGGVINLNLTETWHREYQVLPNRTRPMNTMSGTGGFLLTGTHVGKA